MIRKDADWAFQQYEAVREVLPKAEFPDTSRHARNLGELAADFDVFLLDAFGILNVGETAIAGAAAQVAALQAQDKRVLVLTNGATYPAELALAKYTKLGFRFALEDVVSSRDALAVELRDRQDGGFWGVMGASGSKLETVPAATRLLLLDREVYDAAQGFLFLSTTEWSFEQQEMLHASLAANPRPILVGNPDIVAPREDGLSLEPGHFAHELARDLGFEPQFFGKPFTNVYDLAFSRLGEVDSSRVLMVGDTLHTDVLGGAAYGVKTALITDHGLFAGREVAPYISKSGIQPDFILPTT
jgi:HAD superfamily hydrolase (TIGR01459 family)